MDVFVGRTIIIVALLGNFICYFFPPISPAKFFLWWNIIWYVLLWPIDHGNKHD